MYFSDNAFLSVYLLTDLPIEPTNINLQPFITNNVRFINIFPNFKYI